MPLFNATERHSSEFQGTAIFVISDLQNPIQGTTNRSNFNSISLVPQAQAQTSFWKAKHLTSLRRAKEYVLLQRCEFSALTNFQQDRHLTSNIPSLKQVGRLEVSHVTFNTLQGILTTLCCERICTPGEYIVPQWQLCPKKTRLHWVHSKYYLAGALGGSVQRAAAPPPWELHMFPAKPPQLHSKGER